MLAQEFISFLLGAGGFVGACAGHFHLGMRGESTVQRHRIARGEVLGHLPLRGQRAREGVDGGAGIRGALGLPLRPHGAVGGLAGQVPDQP